MTALEVAEASITAADARQIAKRAKAALAKGNVCLWDLAEALYDFDEACGWLALGYGGWTTCVRDELGVSPGSYRRYVRTWRVWVVDQGVDPAVVRQWLHSRAAVAVDALSLCSREEVICDIEEMSVADLRKKYYVPRKADVKTVPPGQVLRVLRDIQSTLMGPADSDTERVDWAIHLLAQLNTEES